MNNLRNFRKANHLTQQEVAAYLNIGRSSYTKYECGMHVPDIFILDKLATLFHITLDELVGRTVSAVSDSSNNQELNQTIKMLEGLPPEDIKEIQSYIEFKRTKKNTHLSTKNIG